MEQIFAKAFSIILVSLSIILLIVSEIIFKINKKKGWISFILSLIFVGFSLYYVYLFFYLGIPSSIQKKVYTPYDIKKTVIKETEKLPVGGKTLKEENISFFVYLEINGNTLKVEKEDEIEIGKNTKFKIVKVETIPEIKNIEANLVGFVPKGKNTANDIGYLISYDELLKRKAIDQEKTKFELIIKSDEGIIGKVYFKFI